MLTSGQIRAARAMLRMSQRQMASLAHVSLRVIQRFERGRGAIVGDPVLLASVKTAIEDAGVVFIASGTSSGTGGPGLRLSDDGAAVRDIIDLDSEATAIGSDKTAA